jgi:hypothetical protein
MQRTGTTISQDLKNENDLGPFTRTVRDEKSIDIEYVRDKLSIFNGTDSALVFLVQHKNLDFSTAIHPFFCWRGT